MCLVSVFLVLFFDFYDVVRWGPRRRLPCEDWVNSFDGLSFFQYATCRIVHLFVATPAFVVLNCLMVFVALLAGQPWAMFDYMDNAASVILDQALLILTFIVSSFCVMARL